jgi:PPOX class probable F420-dependent enzyme
MTLEGVPGWASEMLSSERVARLAFLDDRDRPRVLPVTFALAAGAVWSAVDEKPKRVGGEKLARVRYLRRRPEAGLVVDRYDDDWSRLAWVQVMAHVEIVPPDEAPAGLEALATKYSPYRETPPGGPLLRLDPHRVLHWRASDAR